MYTSAEEYFKKIYQITSSNFPTLALLLPSTETIYNIDLSNRVVEAPEYLSVKTDHFAETIYFKCDRYFDNMDLTDTMCLIQYKNKNADDDGHYYAVPFYDTAHFQKPGTSEEDRGKIIIPWCISGTATAYEGPITFVFHFFKVGNTENNGENIEVNLDYSLSTLPAESKILYTLGLRDKDNLTEEEQLLASDYMQLVSRVGALERDYQLYWDEA